MGQEKLMAKFFFFIKHSENGIVLEVSAEMTEKIS